MSSVDLLLPPPHPNPSDADAANDDDLQLLPKKLLIPGRPSEETSTLKKSGAAVDDNAETSAQALVQTLEGLQD